MQGTATLLTEKRRCTGELCQLIDLALFEKRRRSAKVGCKLESHNLEK